MLWPIRESGDVYGAIFLDNYDVMLAVAACTSVAFRDGQHWLHRDHHSWFQHCMYVLTQLQSCLTTVVVGQNTEAMAVTKTAVLQQVTTGEELIYFGADVGTHRALFDDGQAKFVCFHVSFPNFQTTLVGFAQP